MHVDRCHENLPYAKEQAKFIHLNIALTIELITASNKSQYLCRSSSELCTCNNEKLLAKTA